MTTRIKNQWFIGCILLASVLLVNPLYAWAGFPAPTAGFANGNPLAKLLLFVTSVWGIRDALNGVLEISLGKLFPKLIYKFPPE